MSEFKGSPGPWVAFENGLARCAVKDARGIWLTYRAGDSNQLSNEEVEANARVMAAAPELLEALIAIRSIEFGHSEADICEVRMQCDAAIAKATGDQPC
jgi:hypothetical protein